MHRTSWVVGLASCIALGLSLFATSGASAQTSDGVFWRETFDRDPLDFVDLAHPRSHASHVYSVVHEGDESFLHALHDDRTGRVPAEHFGKPFQVNPPPLEKVKALKWRWRVLQHPNVTRDPWEDVAASVYVVMRTPSLIRGGHGFKFGWLAEPGPSDTRQHGILQLPLRHDPAGPEWRAESVDLCALYRASYGPCEGEHVLYVGVVTDADGTRSVAEADYDDFELVGSP